MLAASRPTLLGVRSMANSPLLSPTSSEREVAPMPKLSPTKEAAIAASSASASASSGAAFVTPHKSRPSTNNTSSTESSMSSTSTSTNTPTPTRYLPLLREIQDIQEMTADSLNTSKAVYEMTTQGVVGTSTTSSSGSAARVEASPTTMNSSFSFGVF